MGVDCSAGVGGGAAACVIPPARIGAGLKQQFDRRMATGGCQHQQGDPIGGSDSGRIASDRQQRLQPRPAAASNSVPFELPIAPSSRVFAGQRRANGRRLQAPAAITAGGGAAGSWP